VAEDGSAETSEDSYGDSLRGTTMKVYRYMYRAGRPFESMTSRGPWA